VFTHTQNLSLVSQGIKLLVSLAKCNCDAQNSVREQTFPHKEM